MWRLIIAFILFCYTTIIFAENKNIASSWLQQSTKVPAGFEDLVAPQRMLMDIYYGENKVGTAYATYSKDSFIFEAPEKIANMIPELKRSHQTITIKTLTGKINPHRELVCHKPNKPQGCGVLNPEIVGVIFNDTYYIVHIFVDPHIIEKPRINISRYLPWQSEEKNLNGLVNLTGQLDGADGKNLNYNLRNSSIFSHHLMRLKSETTFSNDVGMRVESLVAEKEWQDELLTMGMFQTTPVRLIGQQDVLGLRLGKSLNLRTDLDNAYAQPLTIFLDRRSVVKVFRDNRLLSSKIYEYGSQNLDTRGFPDGAYEVVIEIEDRVSGKTKTVRHFFSKTRAIPPLDAPHYFTEIGFLRDNFSEKNQMLPRYSAELFAQIGGIKRFTDTLAADVSVSYIADEYFANMGMFSIQSFLNSQVRLGGIVGSSGVYGVEVSASGRYGNFSGYLDFRKFWNQFDPAPNSVGVNQNAYTQANVAVNYYFSDVNLGLNGQWRQNRYEGIDTTEFSFSPTVDFIVLQSKSFNLRVEGNYTMTQDEDFFQAKVRLEFHKPISKGLQVLSQLEGKYSSSKEDKSLDYQANLALDWSDEDLLVAEVKNKTAFKYQDERLIIQNENSYESEKIGLSSFVEHTVVGNNNVTADTYYGVGFNLSLLGSKDDILLGGEIFNADDAAIVIDLQGEQEQATFDILVTQIGKENLQEYKHSVAIVGEPKVLALEAYESYLIRIVAASDNFSAYDVKPRKITLYPGNVKTLLWDVSQVFILVTTVVKPDGSLLKNATVTGTVEPTLIDAQGFLQADVKAGAKLSVSSADGKHCTIQLPKVLDAVQGIVSLNAVVCQP